jgi:hypothetical protein
MRLDLGVEITKEGRQRTRALDLKMADEAVAVPMQVAAFIRELLVPVGRVELVLFLNNHGGQIAREVEL